MSRFLLKFPNLFKLQSQFLLSEPLLSQQIRTTYILRRRCAPYLHKKGQAARKMRGKHYIYDVLSNTGQEKQPSIDVILTSFVDGLGNIGEIVNVKELFAYNKLLVPGLAVYASPENLEKYKEYQNDANKVIYTSKYVPKMIKVLEENLWPVIMNKEMPWILKPWHVAANFRRSAVIVPEYAITLPERKIEGPNLDIENKEFYVTVTINQKEKVNVRCRIHHWGTNIADRLPHAAEFWKQKSEPIFPEFTEILDKIPTKYITEEDPNKIKL